MDQAPSKIATALRCALTLLSGLTFSLAQSPNILFIGIDDLKPTLGCYGDILAQTPRIDQLAARGTVFLNAHCQWPVCGPSRASLMTSLRPEAVGVMDLKTDMRLKNKAVLTIPQHFKNQGYTTAGTGKIYDPRCVDNKTDCDAPSWSRPFVNLRYNELEYNEAKDVTLAPVVPDERLADGQIGRNGLALLQDLASEETPFFLAVGFKKPHLPFIAPKRYWDFYKAEDFALATPNTTIKHDSGYVLHDSPELRGYKGVPKSGPIQPSLQRQLLHGYYACTSYIDAQVGLLVDELKRLDLLDSTIIVLWGDHGFHLGDHGMWGKHSTLEQAARVPLIIVPPKGASSASTKAPTELTDMFPTLCELAGLEIPDGLAGKSAGPVIRGDKQTVRAGALTVFKKKGAMGYSLRTTRYRYTEWVNKSGALVGLDLFDYETDSMESENLATSELTVGLRLQLAKLLRDEAIGCERLPGPGN